MKICHSTQQLSCTSRTSDHTNLRTTLCWYELIRNSRFDTAACLRHVPQDTIKFLPLAVSMLGMSARDPLVVFRVVCQVLAVPTPPPPPPHHLAPSPTSSYAILVPTHMLSPALILPCMHALLQPMRSPPLPQTTTRTLASHVFLCFCVQEHAEGEAWAWSFWGVVHTVH